MASPIDSILELVRGFTFAGNSFFGNRATKAQAKAAAEAITLHGQYQETMFNVNADLAEEQALDALSRGFEQSNFVRQSTENLVGQQRASFGAQGVDVNRGSAAEVQESTLFLGDLDSARIRNNAARLAYGFNRNATILRNQGRQARIASRFNADATILTGDIEAASGLAADVFKFVDASLPAAKRFRSLTGGI